MNYRTWYVELMEDYRSILYFHARNAAESVATPVPKYDLGEIITMSCGTAYEVYSDGSWRKL